jgi:WD40 repeat protein
VSGSHDTTIRVWALSGQVLAELVGHTALVYAVAAGPGGILASGEAGAGRHKEHRHVPGYIVFY